MPSLYTSTTTYYDVREQKSRTIPSARCTGNTNCWHRHWESAILEGGANCGERRRNIYSGRCLHWPLTPAVAEITDHIVKIIWGSHINKYYRLVK